MKRIFDGHFNSHEARDPRVPDPCSLFNGQQVVILGKLDVDFRKVLGVGEGLRGLLSLRVHESLWR